MTTILADCHQERKAFVDFLQFGSSKHILMFHGESGTGKTSLLNACLENIPTDVRIVPFNCKRSSVSVAEIFYRVGYSLGWNEFQNFIEQVARLSKSAQIKIDENWLIGINNHISVALHGESMQDHEERRVALTDAWFKDLNGLEKFMLISIDTFEEATAETAEWITGPFLYRAARTANLRVLIAGGKIPDTREYASEWGYSCDPYQLSGVQDAEHWLRVVEDMGREATLDLVKGICLALHGRPADIMNVIYGLPRQAGRL